MLSERVTAAIRQEAYDSQAGGREQAGDDPEKLRLVAELVRMIEDLTLSQMDTYYRPILAAVWQEAIEQVQNAVSLEVFLNGPLTEGSKLTLVNPYV